MQELAVDDVLNLAVRAFDAGAVILYRSGQVAADHFRRIVIQRQRGYPVRVHIAAEVGVADDAESLPHYGDVRRVLHKVLFGGGTHKAPSAYQLHSVEQCVKSVHNSLSDASASFLFQMIYLPSFLGAASSSAFLASYPLRSKSA